MDAPLDPPLSAPFADQLRWHRDIGTRPDGVQAWRVWGNKELAHIAGVSTPNAASHWCNGKRRPPREAVEKLADAFFGDRHPKWRAALLDAHGSLAPAAESTGRGTTVGPPPEHFLGRDADVRCVTEALLAGEGASAVLIQGPPGVGKTSLTKAVAHTEDAVRRFGEAARWFAALDTAETAQEMLDTIAAAIGTDPKAGLAPIRTQLAHRPGLLVLDNLETPWHADRAGTGDLLAALGAIPALSTLASFRGTARVAGLAWALEHTVEVLEPPAAKDLFCRIAAWPDADDPILDDFTHALGGLPLAIELVATRAHGRPSLDPLWRQWQAVGADFAQRDGGGTRLDSLPHSIELSLAAPQMHEDARRLFALLGQLPAGIHAEDRDALVGDGAFDAEETLLHLALAHERGDRLDLLPPIRDHAARHHPPTGDDAAWPHHYLTLVAERGKRIGTRDDPGIVARLTPDHPNIERAALTAMDAGDHPTVAAATGGLFDLTNFGSLPAFGMWTHLAARFAAADNPSQQAWCWLCAGVTAFNRSQNERARTAYEEALPLYRQVGDVQGEANCIRSLGDIALRQSDHAAARTAYEEALPLYRQVGHVLGEANCIKSLGDIALGQSDHAAARTAYEEALPLYRQVGDVLGEASCITRLGDIALRQSDHAAARTTYEEALPLYRQVGSVLGEASCIKSLGDIALDRSDHAAARTTYEEALPLYRQVGDVLGEANCIRRLGDIALARSDHAAACTSYEEALLLYRQVGDVLGEANCIKCLGDIALDRSDHAAACTAYEEALPLYRQVGAVWGEANCAERFGDLAAAAGDTEGAAAHYAQSVALWERFGNAVEAGRVAAKRDAL